jgi:hypothetical protein
MKTLNVSASELSKVEKALLEANLLLVDLNTTPTYELRLQLLEAATLVHQWKVSTLNEN